MTQHNHFVRLDGVWTFSIPPAMLKGARPDLVSAYSVSITLFLFYMKKNKSKCGMTDTHFIVNYHSLFNVSGEVKHRNVQTFHRFMAWNTSSYQFDRQSRTLNSPLLFLLQVFLWKRDMTDTQNGYTQLLFWFWFFFGFSCLHQLHSLCT